jgi:HK97 gp10 family phage protein
LNVEFRVETDGVDDFARKMRRLDEATQEYVQDALNRTGQEVMHRARQLAPVKTGRLMQSIYAQMIYRWVVKVGCYAPYAYFQEFGTRYIQPRYFLTRALEESRMQFLTIVVAALQRAVEEASIS